MKFYLGTDEPSWLRKCNFPLFVSRTRLHKRKTFPRCIDSWALDSGAFTEINRNGRWLITPKIYAREVLRYQQEIGNMDWAAIQDWMCEPFVLNKTGKTIGEHQRLTIDSFLELKRLNSSLPFIPVLQGWQPNDYLRHVEMYSQRGIDLTQYSTVGVGSVCRRQHTDEAAEIIIKLHNLGLKLHGFGFKIQGLRAVGDKLVSSDSMSWSITAWQASRKGEIVCPEGKNACQHCLHYAIEWRNKVLGIIK